jgi:hypothetical protein
MKAAQGKLAGGTIVIEVRQPVVVRRRSDHLG